MSFKIYNIVDSANSHFASDRFDRPVYQERSKDLIELGFNGRYNDFDSIEEARLHIANTPDLAGWNLVILEIIRP